MAQGWDAADGKPGELAHGAGIGPLQGLAEQDGNRGLVHPVGPRHQQQIGPAGGGAAKHQRFDDLADGAAAGRGRLLGAAVACGMCRTCASSPLAPSASLTRWAAGLRSAMICAPSEPRTFAASLPPVIATVMSAAQQVEATGAGRVMDVDEATVRRIARLARI